MASKKKVVKKKVSKKKVAKKKVAKKKDTWKNPEGAFSPENRTHLEMMVGMVAERPELMEKVRVGGSLFVMKTMGLSLHDAQVFAREIKHLHNENLKKQREEEKQTKKKRAKKKVARKKAAKRTMGGDDVSQSKPLPQQIFDKPETLLII